jgi:hypothetical protein
MRVLVEHHPVGHSGAEVLSPSFVCFAPCFNGLQGLLIFPPEMELNMLGIQMVVWSAFVSQVRGPRPFPVGPSVDCTWRLTDRHAPAV